MRILHTSDWHVGRRWKGIQQLDEMEAILGNLAGFIERESIDLVLHTGDVFDSKNPTGEAERLVNEFFVRVGSTGSQTVLIAGNHDDPDRLDARALLAEFANVRILGRPQVCGPRRRLHDRDLRRRESRRCSFTLRLTRRVGIRP